MAWGVWLERLRGPKPALAFAFATLIITSGIWLAFEVRRTRQEAMQRQAEATPPFVVLALAGGPGVRSGAGASPTLLTIPPQTAEVRLQLTLQESEHPTYRVILRGVGGSEVLRRTALTPTAAASGSTITLNVPAGQLQSGDYILTLQGAAPNGEFDDLSQHLIRVEKK